MTKRNTPKPVNGEKFQLLSTFKAIYDTGSTKTAAEILGITQSAASKHLQKLREWLEDELFVRTPGGMEPTNKASHIIERVQHILQEVVLLTEEQHFSPSKLTGTFTIATTGEISQRLLPPLLKIRDEQSPKLRISIINLTSDYSIRELETGKVNIVISVNWHAPEQLIQKRLFTDHFVCVMHKQNPLAQRELSIECYAEASHAMVAPLGKERGFIDDHLTKHGLSRHINLSVPDFNQLTAELLGKQHIATLPYRVAQKMEEHKNIMIKELPFDPPKFDYYIFWHQRFNHEPSNLYMREQLESLLST